MPEKAVASTSMSFLSPTQRYAAGALFGLALHQAQIHQSQPLGSSTEDGEPASERSSSSSSDSMSENPERWVHQNSGLFRPVLRFLEIDCIAWPGLEETAGTLPAKNHVGAFLRLLSEENFDSSPENSDQELALSKAVDAMVESMKLTPSSFETKKEKHSEYEEECREKCSSDLLPKPELDSETPQERTCGVGIEGQGSKFDDKPVEEVTKVSYQRKVTVLYELLSGCLADIQLEGGKKCNRKRRGYDARHRVALRLLATWLDLEWITMEAIETIVACSAMAFIKEKEAEEEETQSSKSTWSKWKRGGIIGAAALTGGTLMAITGGLAAPAIAAGFSALAPTLGTLIPVIGASGFAAAASAAGTVAGSVAVAASFGAAGAGLTGSKMARRTGSVDEFEFKAIGENHNQGRLAVEILVSGFVLEEEDFIRPWEGQSDNLERYALQWESKNLVAVSTAIQDWLTSRISMELMKQGAMLTVLSTLLTALAWPATLLAAADFIDSKWSIAVDRSDKAGRLLAEVLLKGLQGNRPVTLVGYSLGARVIFKCLQFLAETENNGGQGDSLGAGWASHLAELVERVVLLGAPVSINNENWEAARKMVAGRFVNAYSTNDWTLGVAFRASLLSQGLAGIQAVNIEGVENIDVTDLIEGHSSYLWATKQILEQLELDTYYPVFRTLIKP